MNCEHKHGRVAKVFAWFFPAAWGVVDEMRDAEHMRGEEGWFLVGTIFAVVFTVLGPVMLPVVLLYRLLCVLYGWMWHPFAGKISDFWLGKKDSGRPKTP